MISGDSSFTPGHPRFDLQQRAVERLEVLLLTRRTMMTCLRRLWSLRRGACDVVTSQDPFWRGLFAWRAAGKAGAKLNIQVHADLRGQSLIRHILAQIVLRHADSVRVVSLKIKGQVERMGVRTPIHVLPVFIDLERFRSLPRQPSPVKTILWIGRFEAEKDPLAALAVLTAVRGSGIDARLVMLGAGQLEAELRRRALGLPVEFPGWQDPRPYLAQADVVLSTSLHESWGASIVEALAAGVPVVAPDVGIAREAGATVVPRDQLARAVVDIIMSGARGHLLLSLPTEEAWAQAWRASLT